MSAFVCLPARADLTEAERQRGRERERERE
eukprot:COSAG03_NODE_12316_length_552_cov_1.200883_1_plen_29_part_10